MKSSEFTVFMPNERYHPYQFEIFIYNSMGVVEYSQAFFFTQSLVE